MPLSELILVNRAANKLNRERQQEMERARHGK